MENIKELNYRIFNNYSRYHIYSNGIIIDTKLNKHTATWLSPDGYLKCTLTSNIKERKTFSVHRIIAICFIENINNLPEVNHKDGNKQNNDYTNLEWCTHSYNIQHAWNNNLIKNTKQRSDKISNQKKRIGLDNHKSKKVILLNTGEIFESGHIASKIYNVKQEQLNRCCNPNHPAKSAGKDVNGKPLIWKYYKNENESEGA